MEDHDRSKKPRKDELEKPETADVSADSFQIEGTAVLTKKNLLGVRELTASVVDTLDELRGKKVSLQLISSTALDQDSAETCGAKLGKRAHLEDWITTKSSITAGDVMYKVTFEWSKEMGVPGAFTIANSHHNEFYLKSLTLEDVPHHGRVHFVCNSWVYPAKYYKKDRVFFANKAYLPSQTPAYLKHYREDELKTLRGNGTGKLEEWDRVYDYDIYNDLSDPDKDEEHIRPILGGSEEYPYPRRGRTGRPPSSSDPKTESRLPIYKGLSIYVPRDERFSQVKLADAAAYGLKSLLQNLGADFKALFDKTPREFDSFDDVLKLYEWERDASDKSWVERIGEHVSFELIRELFRSDGEKTFKFPVPQVIKEDKLAWSSDEEFGRELLAGLSPVVIKRLDEFPPTCKLDPKIYGNQSSTISDEHILSNLEGLTVTEAIESNKLFILDHHESLMPFLRRINNTSIKTYATRTILFLKDDGTLKPLAIELSLPHPNGDHHGSISRVCTPVQDGVESVIWQLAKAYVAVDDSGFHQLICHWLHTHATIEPFVIATNRQLSVLHPIHKLLQPHFRDTMNVNALARQTLLNAGGFLEYTLFQGKYSVEFSSMLYKEWSFPEQALPADLLCVSWFRGIAVEDPQSKQGIRLLIEDYPYAVDGLDIWAAIKSWVDDYCKIYYDSDNMVQDDAELQLWWKEIREEGHGDKKHEPWWPKMQTRQELIDSLTTIIWTASALHAAVNFGQYPYGGYPLNRPATSRRLIPEPGTKEYEEMAENPEKAYLRTITSLQLSVLGISLVEILSRHTTDEVFLGQRESDEWTKDDVALEAFGRFGVRLGEIEKRIVERNEDPKLKNRVGPVKMPYTLLYPSSGVGLTGKGIPNSISI